MLEKLPGVIAAYPVSPTKNIEVLVKKDGAISEKIVKNMIMKQKRFKLVKITKRAQSGQTN